MNKTVSQEDTSQYKVAADGERRDIIPVQHACDQALSVRDLSKVETPESGNNRVKGLNLSVKPINLYCKGEDFREQRFESKPTGGLKLS